MSAGIRIVDVHSLAGFLDAALDQHGEAGVATYPLIEEYLFQFHDVLAEYQVTRKPELLNRFAASNGADSPNPSSHAFKPPETFDEDYCIFRDNPLGLDCGEPKRAHKGAE